MAFDQRSYTTGSVYAWSLVAPTRDGGQAWDVTGASVRLYLCQPGGNPLTFPALRVGGLWQASCGPADLSAPGLWLRTWEVTDAAGTHRALPIPFVVTEAVPAARAPPPAPGFDHSLLSRLDFASAGHTGFAPAARQVLPGTGLSGGGDLSADRTLSLADTAVAPGSYANAGFTVDAQGRLTAASSGTAAAFLPAYSVAASGARNAARYDYQCDGAADEAEIAAAVAALPAGGGLVLLSEGTFNLAAGVAVGVPGVTLRGAGRRATVLNQTTYGLPCLEVRSADDVTVEGVRFLNTQAKAVVNGTYDGRPARDRAAGVYAADSNRLAVRGCSFLGLVVGVKLRGDTASNSGWNVGNVVRDCAFDSVDFGVLAEQQARFALRDLESTATTNSQGANPPHLVYLTWGAGPPPSRNKNGVVSGLRCDGNPYGSLLKAKMTDGSVFSDVTAEGHERLIDLEDCRGCTLSGVVGRAFTAPEAAGDTQQGGVVLLDCQDCVVSGLVVDVTGRDDCPGVALRYSGAAGLASRDVRVADATVLASYTAANTRGGYHSEGTLRATFDGVEFVTTGDSAQPAVLLRQLASPLTGSVDCAVRNLGTQGTNVAVKVNTSSDVGNRLELNRDMLRGNPALPVADNGTGTRLLYLGSSNQPYAADAPPDHGYREWNFNPEVAGSTGLMASGSLYLLKVVARTGGAVSAASLSVTTAGAALTAATTAAVTAVANSGSGLCRVTAAAHGYATNDVVTVAGVAGTAEANGAWVVTVVDANTFDLAGSSFANAYVSGGTATRSANAVALYDSGGAFLTAAGDQSAAWTTAGVKSATLAKAVTLAPGATYYVALLSAGTTPPTLARASSGVFNAGVSGAALRAAVNGTGLTKLPSSVVPASNSGSGVFSFWVAAG